MRASFAVATTVARIAVAAPAEAQVVEPDGARAEAPGPRAPIDVRASDVEIDARTRELDLRGDVRVDSPPFHLRSEHLRVRRGPLGVEVTGVGRLAFCPCLGAPLAVRFTQASVAPPGDLLLRDPRLEVYGVPVLWTPWFWLRSAGRVGVLPPDVAYRGADGAFVGDGVHVPWRTGDERSGLDLRGGAYLVGGVAVDGRLATPSSTTRVRWDRLRGDGLAIDARGATASARDPSTAILAWDVDAIRGARGVAATTEVDAAARRWDRAAAETSWRDGGWTFASGVRATTLRGGDALDLGAVGPVASVRRADAIGGAGAYDATIEGGALRERALSLGFARGEAGAILATRAGAMVVSLQGRGTGAAVTAGDREAIDGAASLRLGAGLPLGRAYASNEPNDPWLHRVEPGVAVAALASRGDALLGAIPGRGAAAVHGEAWLAEGRLTNALGRWGARDGAELATGVGVVGALRDPGAAQLASRTRLGASGAWIGAFGETARVWTGAARGGVVVARARLGPLDGLHVAATVAERDGVDPIVARALTDAALEPSSGFLAAEGWTGGARAQIPWGRYVLTRGGVEADLSSSALVAAWGGVELRNPCGCLVVRGNGAHRVGRDGVDVWITIDLAPSAL